MYQNKILLDQPKATEEEAQAWASYLCAAQKKQRREDLRRVRRALGELRVVKAHFDQRAAQAL